MRIIGIQAMELTSYRTATRAGDCHAVDATRRLEQLVRRSKGKIRVSALYTGSRSRGRRLRSVAVRRGKHWRDVGRILVSEGLALWWPGLAEDASNARYSLLSQKAAAARKGLFDPEACGIGPNQGHPIGLWAQWDADGNDRDDVNGEYVKIRNYDVNNWLPLSGWYLRDSGLRRFTFPPGSAVPPNSSVTVYAGIGEDAGTDFYWGLSAPVFENASKANPDIGDGAYLFDPRGNVRAWMIYPCKVACSNPAKGSVAMSVQPKKDEYISLRQHRRRADRPRAVRAQVAALLLRVLAGDRARAGADHPRAHPGRPVRGHRDRPLLGHGQADPQQRRRRRGALDLQRRRDRLQRIRLEVLLSRSE